MRTTSSHRSLFHVLVILAFFSLSYGCGENAKKQPPSPDATEPADKGVKALQTALPEPQVSKLTPNPEAEREVEEKVKAGKTADLKELFPNKADRVLSASFLRKLLTNPPKNLEVHRLTIKNAVFVEPINLSVAEIPYETVLISCDFKEEVNLKRSHFHRSLGIMSSSFTKVRFGAMKVEGVLDATNAKFTSFDEKAKFHAMNVGHANFQNALFNGPVDFASVNIDRGFIVDAARFTNPDKRVSFNGINVGGSFAIRSAKFAGTVNFVGANIRGQFRAEGAKFANDKKKVLFSNMKVEGAALFRPVREEDIFLSGVRKIVGDKVVFAGPVSFANSTFGSIDLSDVSWPESVKLGGMSYKSIYAGDSWEKLLELADRSKFSTSVYLNLESFFEQFGYSDRADKIFIAMKRRQFWRLLHGWGWLSNLPSWTWNLFLDVFIGYGRAPLRAVLWGFLLVILNWRLGFSHKEGMEPQMPEYISHPYSGFWYSLDLFLPVIDLQAANVWMPKQDRWIARNWIRWYRIIGWIIIPIGLAAVTGIIK